MHQKQVSIQTPSNDRADKELGSQEQKLESEVDISDTGFYSLSINQKRVISHKKDQEQNRQSILLQSSMFTISLVLTS